MDYDDDDYDQYRQYEDELYRDASEQSESENELDSELEDNMLAHIHYSTDVYKKVGNNNNNNNNSNAAETDDGQEIAGSVEVGDTTTRASNRHLTTSPNAAEDYFKAVNQGTELDSDNDEEGIVKSSRSKSSTNTTATKAGSRARSRSESRKSTPDFQGSEDEEESRYNVEKKKDASNKSWSRHATLKADDHSNSSGADENDDQSDDSEDEDQPADQLRSGTSSSSDSDADEDDVYSEFELEESELDQHVLDLSKPSIDANSAGNTYDLKRELGHLEEEEFKGRSRYYMEPTKEREILCHRCNKPGHLSRDCTRLVCTICGAVDDHAVIDCPLSVCFNCRKKGHIADDCPTVWREYIVISKQPLQRVVQYCYNCAALGHFGDDCPRIRPSYARSYGSAFFANSDSTSLATFTLSANAKKSASTSVGSHTRFSSSPSSRPSHHGSSSKRDSSSRHHSDRHTSSSHHKHGASSWSRHDSHRHLDSYRDDHRDRDRDRGRDRDDRRHGSSSHKDDYHDNSYDRDHKNSSDRSSKRSDHKRKKEKKWMKDYKDPDDQRDDYSAGDLDRHDYLFNHAADAGVDSNNSNSSNSKRKRNRKRDQDRADDNPLSSVVHSSMAPTTATGASIGGNQGGGVVTPSYASNVRGRNYAATAPGSGIQNPVVIQDSSSPASSRPSSRSSNYSKSSNHGGGGQGGKLHHSLPNNPNQRGNGRIQSNSSNINSGVSSSRPSFAEQNAYPRGGGARYGGGAGGNNNNNTGLIGVPPSRPSNSPAPGPMYTGGYSRRR
ncbi:hypothetical protein EDD11_002449 [Mortierella claussenii]|nr:hypothetical protein EDD11_002449 [Mortierella claussenii]